MYDGFLCNLEHCEPVYRSALTDIRKRKYFGRPGVWQKRWNQTTTHSIIVVTHNTFPRATCSARVLLRRPLPRSFLLLWKIYPRSHRALGEDVIVTETKSERGTETGIIVGLDTINGTKTEIGTRIETEPTIAVTTTDAPHPPRNPPRNDHVRPAGATRARSTYATATPSQAKSKSKRLKLGTSSFRLG